ncbi:uncharacterized protein LOC135226727 [Macrobrachium nipponense]|uniref:uncharacterized protein LOC135226727 n=1 Tax=Macrobrachium nipponense TaxID=159736 RepID=UPI0030C7A5E4
MITDLEVEIDGCVGHVTPLVLTENHPMIAPISSSTRGLTSSTGGSTSSPSFKCLQLPISLAFTMTINNAQGQCLRVAGINLKQTCFSHGQLYVAWSRVGSPERLFILSPEGKIKNLVYQKALR